MRGLFFVLVLFSTHAWAAFEKGNGGDVITSCEDKSRPKVQFYDLYEAEERYGLTLAPAEGATATDKAQNLIARLTKLNPNRAKLYTGWLQTFFQETKFRRKSLIDIPDTGAGFIPTGCKLDQLIVQVDPYLPGDKRYTINEDLWEQMDANNQAAAIMHELILREAALPENNHETSQLTRYIHAIVESTQMAEETTQGWVEKLTLAHFYRADWVNNPIRLDPAPEFYDANHFKLVYLFGEGHFESAQVSFDYECAPGDSSTKQVLVPVELYPNGNLKATKRAIPVPSSYNNPSCTAANPVAHFNSLLKFTAASPAKDLRGMFYGELSFYENGVPVFIYSLFRFNPIAENSLYHYQDINGVSFWPDGSIKSLSADRYANHLGEFGKIDLFSPQLNGFNQKLIFREDGSIEEVELFDKVEYPVLSEKIKTDHFFLDHGRIKKFETEDYQELTIQSQKIKWFGMSTKDANNVWTQPVIYIYPSGALKCAKVTSQVSLQDESGILQDYYVDMKLMFTESGLVRKVVRTREECE